MTHYEMAETLVERGDAERAQVYATLALVDAVRRQIAESRASSYRPRGGRIS